MESASRNTAAASNIQKISEENVAAFRALRKLHIKLHRTKNHAAHLAIFRMLRKLHIKLTRTKNHNHHAKLLHHGLLNTKYLSTFKTTTIQLRLAAANSTEPHVKNTEAKSTAANKILISNAAM
jgi:hypothetical protein